MKPYAERKADRVVRLQTRAVKVRAEGERRIGAADAISNVIPLGQPILVGHHSERRHRRDIERIHTNLGKGFAALKAADELERRAEAAATNDAISSDDPEAVVKLKTKVTELEEIRARYKEINVTIRTAQRHAKNSGEPWEPIAIKGLVDMGLSEPNATSQVKPDICGRIGIADYEFSNLSANIRRVQQRITQLEAAAARPAIAPEHFGDIRIEESENRIRIYFPGKPAEPIRRELKSSGFRWSPTEGAWQRHTSAGALYYAREIAKKVAGTTVPSS
jgi:hypothetical protein